MEIIKYNFYKDKYLSVKNDNIKLLGGSESLEWSSYEEVDWSPVKVLGGILGFPILMIVLILYLVGENIFIVASIGFGIIKLLIYLLEKIFTGKSRLTNYLFNPIEKRVYCHLIMKKKKKKQTIKDINSIINGILEKFPLLKIILFNKIYNNDDLYINYNNNKIKLNNNHHYIYNKSKTDIFKYNIKTILRGINMLELLLEINNNDKLISIIEYNNFNLELLNNLKYSLELILENIDCVCKKYFSYGEEQLKKLDKCIHSRFNTEYDKELVSINENENNYTYNKERNNGIQNNLIYSNNIKRKILIDMIDNQITINIFK